MDFMRKKKDEKPYISRLNYNVYLFKIEYGRRRKINPD